MLWRCADRSRSHGGLPLAAAAGALVLALTGCARLQATASGRSPARSSYALLQMNLCLSGLGGCFPKTAYPAVLDEAVARIREVRPDAITVSEGCGGDLALIARRTGYHLRFSRVIYGGRPLTCVHPGGRGLFGDAVLTRRAVERADNHDFETQAGPERRRWLCVTDRAGGAAIDVCTAHLATRDAVEVRANDAQCTELKSVLARRAAGRTVIFGGDVNRRGACAPPGFWTRADGSAGQNPGLQQVYGSGLRSPSVDVLPATHTDHDFLLVRARL